MFQISAGQFQQIQAQRRRDFIHAVARWLDREFPRGDWLCPEAEQQLTTWADQAWAWGIQHDELVRCHLYASVVLGDRYHADFPDMESILSSQELDDEVKLAWLTGVLDALRESSRYDGGDSGDGGSGSVEDRFGGAASDDGDDFGQTTGPEGQR
jgi:hypothetical protein